MYMNDTRMDHAFSSAGFRIGRCALSTFAQINFIKTSTQVFFNATNNTNFNTVLIDIALYSYIQPVLPPPLVGINQSPKHLRWII